MELAHGFGLRGRASRAARAPPGSVPREESAGGRPPVPDGAAAPDLRQPKERSMRKGVLASVAALAAGAGVAFGQGVPPADPMAYPAWGGAPVSAAPPGSPMPVP